MTKRYADLPPTFIDLFAGCGGLSLGLLEAGWEGQFCVERDPMAFATLHHNLVDPSRVPSIKLRWPPSIPAKPMGIERVIAELRPELDKFRDRTVLLAGGPPCQGFSTAGRRQHSDPRNQLFRRYVEFVEIIQPKLVLVENVPGMRLAHRSGAPTRRGGPTPFSELLIGELDDLGYDVFADTLDASDFGVPQTRSRLFVIGVSKDLAGRSGLSAEMLLRKIRDSASVFRKVHGLRGTVTAREALSDLELGYAKRHRPHIDPESRQGYLEVIYRKPRTAYQALLHQHMDGHDLNSMRLARHREMVTKRIKFIFQRFEKGEKIRDQDRDLLEARSLGTKKRRIHPLHPGMPSPTVTTLPDDLLHYSEPRILTVREYARLQSFPDWFEFKGNYTTGGLRRKSQCPRYTQVGNAVPPLLAKAIGSVLLAEWNRASLAMGKQGQPALREKAPPPPQSRG